jgi:pyridoxamine 5'-phosphate oxidase
MRGCVPHDTLARIPEQPRKDVRVMSSTPESFSAMRRDYRDRSLAEGELAGDWLTQFSDWFADAQAAGLPEPNAMVLATATPDGRPSARTVLLKALDPRGFVFFTNHGSRKGGELAVNPYASLVFPWFAIQRQVIVCGRVDRIDRAETEAYFVTRPRTSQLGAWASPQSQVVPDRAALDDALAAAADRFPGEIPAPPHWGGLRVRPQTVEFWQGRTGRVHDRLRFRRVTGAEPGQPAEQPSPPAGPSGPPTARPGQAAELSGWVVERLAP